MGYIDLKSISENINDSWLSIANTGITAFKDNKIEDEINQYNNDIYYQSFRWVLPFVAIIISVLSLILTFTCRSTRPNSIQQISKTQLKQ